MSFYYIEEEDDGYDAAGDEGLRDETGNVYGAIDDDLELQTMNNPYYDGEVDMFPEDNRGQRSNEEIITATSNIYYGL